MLARVAEKFSQLPSNILGIEDRSVAWEVNYALTLRLIFSDNENWEKAQEKAKREAKKAGRK